MRALPRRVACRVVTQHRPPLPCYANYQGRHFASSSNGDESPPEGVREVLATLDKIRARKAIFEEYKKQGVFAPSDMSWLANRLMFYHLNRPQHTQLDVVEFLQGAKYAMETTKTAMYSREFADFLVREEAAPGALEPDCVAAKMLQQLLDPISYAAFKDFVLQCESVGAGSEVKEIEVHSAHLESVHYERVAKRSTTNSSGAKVLGVPVHERLKLAVLFDTTEHLSLTLPDLEEEGEIAVRSVVRRNKAIWQFESNVTAPKDIDWIIDPLQLSID